MTRAAHWIRENHQERMPPRMVAFDTEARSYYDGETEVQEWRTGCAIRWRTDTKVSDYREAQVFGDPLLFWRWVAEFTRKGTRTVVWAHNLGYDVRISRMFEILPSLGFHLEWCNLDRNISSATWRSDHGTIVLADSWTWIPLPLATIAGEAGMVKYAMPAKTAGDEDWELYCMQDCEILYNVVKTLMQFVTSEGLGNWQPTGAGMAYATWRHKFMTSKVLVHDDPLALAAEREAMHTGRAEAWRHGKIWGEKWTEVDFRNAYVTIASQIDVPRKLHMHHHALTLAQFHKLRDTFALLVRATVETETPCLPTKIDNRHIWPVGTFEDWWWDNELASAIASGAKVKVHEAFAYVRAPVLSAWASWTLSLLYNDSPDVSAIVRTHIKHCARALIGRLSLRTPSWEYFGTNPEGITGITHVIYPDTGRSTRMLHVGQDTLEEKSREEGKDSLPMITGYIMAECRVRLWEAMNVAGTENLAHVDTDSVLCNSAGLSRLRYYYGDDFARVWSVKGTYRRLEVLGPRQYFRDKQRVTSGVPLRAVEVEPGVYAAEKWSALAADLERDGARSVRVAPGRWHLRTGDPRRADAPGGRGMTVAYAAGACAGANRSSAEAASVGL